MRLAVEILTLAKKHAPGNFSWINGNDVDILSGSNFTRIAIDEARSVDSIMSHYSSELQKVDLWRNANHFFCTLVKIMFDNTFVQLLTPPSGFFSTLCDYHM